MAGCASTGAVPRPFPQPPIDQPRDASREAADVPPPPPAEAASFSPVLETALGLLGSPYLDGGTTPDGFDCSGFTQWVFGQHGVALPRETRDQFAVGTAVAAGLVNSGDLLFFSTVAPGPSHVGIALDQDRFVHAPSARGVVRVERLSASYWQQHFIGARRVDRGD
jgi:peptidoglycan DL-endopeptidase CwlO